LKIAIIGTRGIPNRYGGFEELAEHLSVGLQQAGHAVTVYNSRNHPYKAKEFKGVTIVHCKDPEHRIGTAGQFIYDFNCVKDAVKKNFDVLLFLGYTSSSVWGRFYPKNKVIISNMDGLEWKRSKYPAAVRRFLQYAEKLAVKFSNYFISDSLAIQQYLETKYHISSNFIPYGAAIFEPSDDAALKKYGLEKNEYYMLMARMEPENNIETILRGFNQSDSTKKFLVLGNTNNSYGKKILKLFGADQRIIFAGAVFNNTVTNTLIAFSSLYFHGHSVGGTNPSLLQAMGCGAMIAAHENEFNRSVLNEDAFYFSTAKQVTLIIEKNTANLPRKQMTDSNIIKIRKQYNWPAVIEQYEQFIINCYNLHHQ
jgi:glycosyltransferase involved in cell wall biosynthesis